MCWGLYSFTNCSLILQICLLFCVPRVHWECSWRRPRREIWTFSHLSSIHVCATIIEYDYQWNTHEYWLLLYMYFDYMYMYVVPVMKFCPLSLSLSLSLFLSSSLLISLPPHSSYHGMDCWYGRQRWFQKEERWRQKFCTQSTASRYICCIKPKAVLDQCSVHTGSLGNNDSTCNK